MDLPEIFKAVPDTTIITLQYYDGPISYIQKCAGGDFFFLWVDHIEDEEQAVEVDVWLAVLLEGDMKETLLNDGKVDEARAYYNAIRAAPSVHLLRWENFKNTLIAWNTISFEELPPEYLPDIGDGDE